jgi:hypothetical protein
MKKLLPFIIYSFLTQNLVGQTASSVANGSWLNPTTWNCACIPTNGYSVTINNSVTLNTSLIFNTGGITINNTGALVQDASLNRDIWINGGYFNNGGKADFRYFLLSAGTGFNAGTFTISAFTNSVSFSNSGTIDMDSMWTAATFTNAAPGKIIGDSLTVANNLLNDGRIMITAVTNSGTVTNNNYMSGYAYTNSGTFSNNDSLILTGSIWNRIVFNNNPGGKVRLTKNFHNYHPSTTAVFNNDGNVTVLDSWYNTDTVKGGANGYFQVQDTSANTGFMKGNFTFCDLTPTTINVDLNSGSIAGTLVFCAVGIKENKLVEVSFYPNPSNGTLHVKNPGSVNLKFSVTDVTGKIILEQKINNSSDISLNQPNGIYFLKVTDLNN